MARTTRLSLVIALALPALAAREAGCADGGATPEAVFENFKSAIKEKDFKKAYQQTTPGWQSFVLDGMAMGLSFMEQIGPTQAKEARSLLERHGVKNPNLNNPSALTKQMVAEVKDKPSAIAELKVLLEKSMAAESQQIANAQADAFANSTLSDVKIEGDSAIGTVKITSGDLAGDKPIKFKKIGGVWFVDFALMAPR